MSNSEERAQLAEYVEQARAGDNEARGRIITLTQAKLFKFCILLGQNRELAEDLCQETYIKAFNNLSQLQSPDKLQPWLCQIAKNIFLDLKRSEKKRTPEPVENAGMVEAKDMETILHVQQMLSKLDVEDRFLLLLVDLEGLTYLQAAEMTEKTENAVRSKIHRLRQAILKNLTR